MILYSYVEGQKKKDEEKELAMGCRHPAQAQGGVPERQSRRNQKEVYFPGDTSRVKGP